MFDVCLQNTVLHDHWSIKNGSPKQTCSYFTFLWDFFRFFVNMYNIYLFKEIYRIQGGGDRFSVHLAVTFLDC